MILKVQVSLYPPGGPLMVYDRSRAICHFIPEAPEVMALIGDKPKIYVEGEIVGATRAPDSGRLEIRRVVEDVGVVAKERGGKKCCRVSCCCRQWPRSH